MRLQPPSLALALVFLSAHGLTARAVEKGRAAVPVSVEKVAYRGWTNNLKIANGDTELVVTLDVGPRVISYRLAGGDNVFKNYDEMMGKTGEPEWMIRGGHRLWVGPEDPAATTYAPDNVPVAYKELGPGQVRLTLLADAFGIQKRSTSSSTPRGPRFRSRTG